MDIKILISVLSGVVLSLPMTSYAQFGNLMNQIKNAAEKAQQGIQQQTQPATDQKNAGKQQPPLTPSAVPSVGSNPLQNAGQLVGSDIAKTFRGIWCKSVDSSLNGPIDFKGIKTGDLCQAPDELIVAIEDKLKRSKQPYEWMTQPKVLKEGGSLAIQNVKAGDKGFFIIAIIIDPYKEKAYLGSFSGLICAADSSNSLNADNPFRKALEAKYGKPASAYTEYDSIKAQIDALEKQNSVAKKQALTLKEAKNARDVDNMLPTLKSMLNAANKNAILSLTWDYEPGNKLRPIGATTIIQAQAHQIREIGGCEVTYVDRSRSGSPSLDFGFMLSVAGTQQIDAMEDAVLAKNQANEKEKVQNAPAPKF